MEPTAAKGGPVHPLAWAAVVTSLVAVVLALYGAFGAQQHLHGSPLNVARGGTGLESTRAEHPYWYWLPAAAYVLPFVLGLAAAVAGGEAVKRVERRGEHEHGHGSRHAVFAVMLGGLAAVIAGCMLLAVYGWKHLPSIYTY